MINQDKKNEEDKRNSINQVTAAITGAVVGAGIAVAGAVVMSDKKNREKVEKVLSNAKDQAINYVKDIQNSAENKKNMIGKELVKDKKMAKKVVDTTKKSLKQTVNNIKKAAK